MIAVLMVLVQGGPIVVNSRCRSPRGTLTRVTESWWEALRRDCKINDLFVLGTEPARWVLVVMDWGRELGG